MSSLLSRIERLVKKEEKDRYGGICIETEKIKDFTIDIIPILQTKYKNVYYHNDVRYLPPDCKLKHNINGAFVGNLLSFDF